MPKGKKKGKKKDRRFEATLTQSLKSNWVEVAADGVVGAGLGAAGGILLNQLADVGSLGLNAGIGAGGGLLVGAAAGTAIVHQRECRLANLGNEVLEEVSETLEHIRSEETVADVVRQALEFGVEYLRQQGVKPPKSDDDEDDEDEAETPKKRRGQQRQGQQRQQAAQ